ncbi:MAG: hypothetical protein ACLGQW_11930 [Acidobacteriota bacterium]
MTKEVPRDKIQVTFDNSEDTRKQAPIHEHYEAGTSSLYGRVGGNVTHINRGVVRTNLWSSVFPNAYFDIFKALWKMLRIFFGR